MEVLEQLCESFGRLSLYLLSFLEEVLGEGHDADEALDDNIHVPYVAHVTEASLAGPASVGNGWMLNPHPG